MFCTKPFIYIYLYPHPPPSNFRGVYSSHFLSIDRLLVCEVNVSNVIGMKLKMKMCITILYPVIKVTGLHNYYVPLNLV